MKYEIQSRNLERPYSREWDASAVGRDGNEFDTREEAEDAIEQLKKLGGDWAEDGVEYRIVELGA